jgi:hypothetical protein
MSCTLEDVYWLYERNSTYYYDCNKLGKMDKCENKIDNRCLCDEYQDVLPSKIGNTCLPCSLNRKSYIKPGEECTICFEEILTKDNSYILDCGHGFHKMCIFNAYKTKILKNYNASFSCPLCRRHTGCDLELLGIKYASANPGTLDELENFWLKQDYMIADLCDNKWDHFLGMNKNCKSCIRYRATGEK